MATAKKATEATMKVMVSYSNDRHYVLWSLFVSPLCVVVCQPVAESWGATAGASNHLKETVKVSCSN